GRRAVRRRPAPRLPFLHRSFAAAGDAPSMPPPSAVKGREVLKGYRTIASDNELSSKAAPCFISATRVRHVLPAAARGLPARAPRGPPRIRRLLRPRAGRWRAGRPRALPAPCRLPRAGLRFPAKGDGSPGSRRFPADRARDRKSVV